MNMKNTAGGRRWREGSHGGLPEDKRSRDEEFRAASCDRLKSFERSVQFVFMEGESGIRRKRSGKIDRNTILDRDGDFNIEKRIQILIDMLFGCIMRDCDILEEETISGNSGADKTTARVGSEKIV